MTLNKPQDVARLLAGTGFSSEQIEEALRKEFPDADAPAVTAAAIEHRRKWDDELDREVRKEQDAAIAAEHDEGGK
jgi:hypothetical protein